MGQLSEYLNKLETRKAIGFKTLDEEHVKSVWVQVNKAQINNWKVTNPTVNRQIVKYLARSEDFNGNLDKGIMLIGETGTGKTQMMKAVSLSMGFLQNFRFLIYSGLEMEAIFREENEDSDKLESALKQKMFGIDDIGEEHSTVKVYGTEINVGVEILSKRYNEQMKTGALTFATTNLTLDMLAKKYGKRIESRIHEMFNVIYLTGNDLRK